MPRLTVLAEPDLSLRGTPRGECELVMGPEHLEKVVRRGITQAKVSLEIMTADLKAMLVPHTALGSGRGEAPSIIRLFRSLAQRGVDVRILHAGVPSGAALHELRGGLPPGLMFRRCPRLHAKAVVIDASRMYLGSANLTGAGLGAKGATRRNFEIGLWTESPALIDATLEQFNAIWEGRECPSCGRRDICPVPLEEPEL